MYPLAKEDHISEFVKQHQELFTRHQINLHFNRTLFFLTQVAHESSGLTKTIECMYYCTAAQIKATWPKRFRTVSAAAPYARNPQALANLVYANRMGNGSCASGDGWRCRGHGYIQVTGADGLRAVGAIAGIDRLDLNPEIACDPKYALSVACAFWAWKGLNLVCDTGDFVRCTKGVNGGTIGLEDRKKILARFKPILLA